MTERVTPEAGVVEFFTADHRNCDVLWAAVEAAAETGDVTATQAAFAAFDLATRRHFDMEENVLFPAFEKATGMTTGPTRMMRMEHEQMRGLLSQIARASPDIGAIVEHGDTLLMLTQQHNMKEEGMLYPMAQGQLGSVWSTLAPQLARYMAAT